MRITDLKVLAMAAPGHAETNWTFVKIETDAGIHGVGEASLQYKDAALMAELQAFKRFLLGKDPFQIEHIWTSLHRRVTWTGGPVTMSAISAIDLALWDIKGKALGVPVYELVGGKVRDRVRAYANGWFGGARNAAAAETYYVTVAPHNSNGPISTVASLHLDVSISNCFMQEIFVDFLPLYNEVLTQPLVIEDGYCLLPEGAGWGTDLREDVLRAHPPVPFTPVESEPYRLF